MAVPEPDNTLPAVTGPNHHIPAELLLDYAAGSLGEAASLVVACHLTLCPHCRAGLAAIERAGGQMLEAAPLRPMRPGALEDVLARLGIQETVSAPAPAATGDSRFPAPLRDYLADDVDRISWRWSGKGLQSRALPVAKPRGGMATLLRVAPGAGLPPHTHGGNELTLVLSGGFTDEQGEFRRGDVEYADDAVSHEPIAMLGEPCICLAVTDAPLRFSGRLGWLLNQWARLSA